MNLQSFGIFLLIACIGILLFILFFRFSGNRSQIKKYLLQKLKDNSLDESDKRIYQNQLTEQLQQTDKTGFKLISALILVLLPLSIYIYTLRGTPQAIGADLTQSQPQMSLDEAVAQLEKKLAESPDDVDGQMLYARTMYSLKNFDKAVTAYRKANELVPNESVILTELAEAIAMKNNNHSFLGEPEDLLKQAYQLNPDNQKAIWLYGMTQYEHQNYDNTLELWTRLYDMISDKGAKQQLAQQLNDLRGKLNLPPIQEETYDTLLTATIDIDQSVKSKLQGKQALLYVYTKSTEGMPMPVAVYRQNIKLSDLPVEVTFSDADNLQPSRKLSDFKQILIGARISFSGNAIAQKGDLSAEEQKRNIPDPEQIQLNINSVVN